MIADLSGLVGRLRREPPVRSIRVCDDSLMLFEGDQLRRRVRWGDVLEVVAFKRDLITYDEIRLAFRVEGGWVELGEGIEGWSGLLIAVERHFPTVPPGWYQAVMVPAFEACYRVLYERA